MTGMTPAAIGDRLYVARLVPYETYIVGREGQGDPVLDYFVRGNTLPPRLDLGQFPRRPPPAHHYTGTELPPGRFIYVYQPPDGWAALPCYSADSGHPLENDRGEHNWGYGGQGPADTAYSLVRDATAAPDLADRLYLGFEAGVMATIGRDEEWTLTAREVAQAAARLDTPRGGP